MHSMHHPRSPKKYGACNVGGLVHVTFVASPNTMPYPAPKSQAQSARTLTMRQNISGRVKRQVLSSRACAKYVRRCVCVCVRVCMCVHGIDQMAVPGPDDERNGAVTPQERARGPGRSGCASAARCAPSADSPFQSRLRFLRRAPERREPKAAAALQV